MRRSAAPSSRDGKRPRFFAPYENPVNEQIKEDIGTQRRLCNEKRSFPQVNSNTFNGNIQKPNKFLRSTDEILSIVSDPFASDSEEEDKRIISKPEIENEVKAETSVKFPIFGKYQCSSSSSFKRLESKTEDVISAKTQKRLDAESKTKHFVQETQKDNFNKEMSSKHSDSAYYNVLWAKRSTKKHKIWEGDGILVVKNRCAVLKNASGKEIDRGAGYKINEMSSITEGGIFYIGGKECEIQCEISEDEYKRGKCFVFPENSESEQNSVDCNLPGTPQRYKPLAEVFSTRVKGFNHIGKEKLSSSNSDFCTDADALILPQPNKYQVNSNTFNGNMQKPNQVLRSIEEILSIISDPFDSDSEEEDMRMISEPELENVVKAETSAKKIPFFGKYQCSSTSSFKKKTEDVISTKTQKRFDAIPLKESETKQFVKKTISSYFNNNELPCEPKLSSCAYYNVLWAKRSAKKHKKWEGDGTLVVQNRSAILRNASGKEIDRGAGYKKNEMTSVREGGIFYIGGKECQIQYEISVDQYKSGKGVTFPENSENKQSSVDCNLSGVPQHYKPLAQVFSTPFKSINEIENEKLCNSSSNMCTDPDALILPRPNKYQVKIMEEKKVQVVDVVIEPFLAHQLRPHQKEGIIFMYKCISGFHDSTGQGVILADEMGLGKTLQCIALVWTLCNKGPFDGKPLLRKIIVITPSSLVTNWYNEFHKWLGTSRLSIFAVDQQNKVKDFIRMPKSVLIISYEMFLRSVEALSVIPFDLVICDEGHRIKNLNIKISNVINCLSTMRRILLTGTPIQNDLAEFFSIIEFVNPGILGTMPSFRRYYEKPIVRSQNPNCSADERELGEERANELASITNEFMLRRTQEVINQYLPPKIETVIFCRPSSLQKQLYQQFLVSNEFESYISGNSALNGSDHLMYILFLRKMCNHPALLISPKDSDEQSLLSCIKFALPNDYHPSIDDSGKLQVLEKILTFLYSEGSKRKIVIVSYFTRTLDLIEMLCKSKEYLYLRLDGSTNSSSRQDLVNSFNRSYTKFRIFLLSSKAGGVGFNLIGASHIVLYDIDWNPANDLQAMARVWRDGQKRTVYVYRLLTTGTIEEKIYQRQVSKQSLSSTVFVTPNTKAQFTREELKDLFTFHADVDCLTHDLIDCNCLMPDFKWGSQEQSSTKKNINVNMAELLKWKHIQGPISSNFTDRYVAAAGENITFLFTNEVNFVPKEELPVVQKAE